MVKPRNKKPKNWAESWFKMAERFQKNGMSSIYKGVEVTSNCASLSTGIEFLGENGAVVASFTADDLKEMVKNTNLELNPVVLIPIRMYSLFKRIGTGKPLKSQSPHCTQLLEGVN